MSDNEKERNKKNRGFTVCCLWRNLWNAWIIISNYLILAVLECKPAIPNAVGRSLISSTLGVLTIHFGYRTREFKQGKTVILLGCAVLILVGILYVVGIVPCAMA